MNTHALSVLWEPNRPGGQAKQAVRTACHVCEEQEARAPALSAPCAGVRAIAMAFSADVRERRSVFSGLV